MESNMNTKNKKEMPGTTRDEHFSKLLPLKDALHLSLHMVLYEVPEQATILVVGTGTGPELIYLAEAQPSWNFVAIEPDREALEICRKKCEEKGITTRCTFHEGTLESLPGNETFDAATSILVSHFLPNREARCDFFRKIGARLNSNTLLVSADLLTQVSLDDSRSLLPIWKRTMNYANTRTPPIVPAIMPDELGAIVREGGFTLPNYFYQALLINAWFARKY